MILSPRHYDSCWINLNNTSIIWHRHHDIQRKWQLLPKHLQVELEQQLRLESWPPMQEELLVLVYLTVELLKLFHYLHPELVEMDLVIQAHCHWLAAGLGNS